MDGWAAGSLLRHHSLGRGLVVAVEPTALHVFFPDQETRFATKLRWPAARNFLAQDEQAPDPWLSGLSSFTMDHTSGRYSLAANFMSHEQAVAVFLADHPQAFAGATPSPRSLVGAGRATLWRAAMGAWADAFGPGQATALLDDGEYEELARRVQAVAGSVGNVPGLPTAAEWEEALAPGDEARHFLRTLLGYLSVPSPARARFDALTAATHALGAAPHAAWGMATFLPFVAAPERHALLVPPATANGAARLGTDLHLKDHPTWDAYGRLRKLSARLLERLRPMGARDHADVEVFLHAMGTRKAPAVPRRVVARRKSPQDPAAPPPRRRIRRSA
jgi:hypothetical protein